MTPTRRAGSGPPADAARVDQRLAEELELLAAVGETARAVQEIEQCPHRRRNERGWAPIEYIAQGDDVDPQQAADGLCRPHREGIVELGILGQQDARERVGIDGLTLAEPPQHHLEAQLTKGNRQQMDRIVGAAARGAAGTRRAGLRSEGERCRGHGSEYAEGV